MSFNYTNAQSEHTLVAHVGIGGGGTALMFLPTGSVYPLFNSPHPVDVSGMELAVALVGESATTITQVLASAASTLEMLFFDMGTTATGGTTNPLAAGDNFSNTVTGGYTVHQAFKADGTSTTDLDADDWVTLGIIANATGIAGALQVGAVFIHGIPGDVN
jgi:hypothetical protein